MLFPRSRVCSGGSTRRRAATGLPLLVWAYRRPAERRFVALLTVLVICGLVLAEVAAVHAGAFDSRRMVPTWCVQSALLGLFATAYFTPVPPRRVGA